MIATINQKPPHRQLKIRGFLALHGLTYAALARAMGVTPQAVGMLDRGKLVSPRLLNLAKEAGVPDECLPSFQEKSEAV